MNDASRGIGVSWLRGASRIAVIVGASVTAVGCGGPSYAVGDCVTVDQQIVESELRSIGCDEEGPPDVTLGGIERSAVVYRVEKVIDGLDGACNPQEMGPGGTQFTDEPDDAIYCLKPV